MNVNKGYAVVTFFFARKLMKNLTKKIDERRQRRKRKRTRKKKKVSLRSIFCQYLYAIFTIEIEPAETKPAVSYFENSVQRMFSLLKGNEVGAQKSTTEKAAAVTKTEVQEGRT